MNEAAACKHSCQFSFAGLPGIVNVVTFSTRQLFAIRWEISFWVCFSVSAVHQKMLVIYDDFVEVAKTEA